MHINIKNILIIKYNFNTTNIFQIISLKIESNFLYNSTTKQSLQNIIEQLLEDLNSYSECQIPISIYHFLLLLLLLLLLYKNKYNLNFIYI